MFTPHITMYRIKNISLENFVSHIRPHIELLTAFRVKLDSVQSGDLVNRTLYYPVLHSVPLTKLYSSLHSSLKELGEFPFYPHMSILYKRGMTENEKKQAVSYAPAIHTVHIAKLYIIQSVVSLTEGSDVPEWSVIHEQLLY